MKKSAMLLVFIGLLVSAEKPVTFIPAKADPNVGDWQGKAIHISEKFPDGEDAAVIVQAPDEHIIGASRPAGG